MFLRCIDFTDISLPRWKYLVAKSSICRYFWTLPSVWQAGMVKNITVLSHLLFTLNWRTVAQEKNYIWALVSNGPINTQKKELLLIFSWKHWKITNWSYHIFLQGNFFLWSCDYFFTSFSCSFLLQQQVVFLILLPFSPFGLYFLNFIKQVMSIPSILNDWRYMFNR